MSGSDVTLINYPPSITTEKDRWLLDYYKIDFNDKRTTISPAFMLTVLYNFPRFMSGPPYLRAPAEGFYARSPDDLVAHYDPGVVADRRLHLSASEESLPELATISKSSSQIGKNIRAWAYAYIIQDKALFSESISAGAPPSQKKCAARLYPLLYRLTKRGLAPDSEAQAQRYRELQDAFDQADQILEDGREFLLGGRLHLLDVEFCVNAAPAVMPPQYAGGGVLPSFEDLPAAMKPLVQGFRDRPTGKFIMHMYANHRMRR